MSDPRAHLSWLHPAAVAGDAGPLGRGVFASAPISGGEVVAAFGGQVLDLGGFHALPVDRQVHSLQIGEELFLVCPETADPADLINHCCEPNLGFAGNVLLVALADISTGRQLTFDYAMCDSDPYDEFECLCSAAGCRRKVTGNDWMLPELRRRYRGRFSAYLEARLEALDGPGADTL